MASGPVLTACCRRVCAWLDPVGDDCSKAKNAQAAAKWTAVQNELIDTRRKLTIWQFGLAMVGVGLMIVQVRCRGARRVSEWTVLPFLTCVVRPCCPKHGQERSPVLRRVVTLLAHARASCAERDCVVEQHERAVWRLLFPGQRRAGLCEPVAAAGQLHDSRVL